MVSIIKSISLDNLENDFLEEYNLSPTRLLKEKIWEMKGMVKTVVRDKITRLTNTVDELAKENELLKEKLDVLEKEEA